MRNKTTKKTTTQIKENKDKHNMLQAQICIRNLYTVLQEAGKASQKDYIKIPNLQTSRDQQGKEWNLGNNSMLDP